MQRMLLHLSSLLALFVISAPAFAAPCALNPANPSVTICTPSDGATVSSPVNIIAGVNDSSPVIAMAIYVDNVLATKQNVSEINASINMSPGSHYVVVQAWDQAGRVPKTPIHINVSSSSNPPPSISFSADPSSISAGGSSALNWSTSNATSVSIDNGIGSVGTSGSQTVSPGSTTTYTLTATGPGGTSSATATVSIGSSGGSCSPSSTVPSIHICSPANGSTVSSPVHAQAAPNSNNGVAAIAVYVDNQLAYKQNVQTLDTSLNMSNGSHYLVVQFWDNSGRVTKSSANITVSSTSTNPPSISLSANPTTINSGGSSSLSWTSSNAVSVTIDNGVGSVPTSGSQTVSPTSTTTYTATATASDGSTATSTATVTVNSTTGAPTVTLTANPASISAGQSSTLTWSSTNATSLSIDNGVGTVPASGSTTVSPASTTTYTITASGSGGSKTATATVTVGTVSGTCSPSGSAPSIHICAPLDGSTVSSPVHLQAAPNSNNGVAAIAVYVDNSLAYKQNVQTLDTSINMANGSRYVVVQFWDNSGRFTKASEHITVSPNAGPTINLSANPTSIASGQSSTLTWTSANAVSVTIDNGVGTVQPSGAATVSPASTTTYTATATASNGATATSSATVTVGSASAPTVSLTANPTGITSGQSSTLTWSSTNATSLTIDNGVGTVATSGTKSVAPTATTTFTITATGPGGSATATATVTVNPTATCSPGSVPSVNLCLPQNGSTVTSPVRVMATPSSANGVVAMAVYADNQLVYKQNVQTLDTTINMSNGSHYLVVQFWDNSGNVPAKASANITVSATAGPTVTFTANPTLINSGQSSTLSWITNGASSVVIDNGVGSVPTSGTQSVSPTSTTTYTLTATGSTGTTNATATVSVSGSGGEGGISKINHIVFALQENRSFDNYFGMMNKYRASKGLPQDVDAFTLNSSGVPTNNNPNYARNGSVTVFHMLTMCTENLSPSWNESHVTANFGNPASNTFLNDGFVWVQGQYSRNTGGKDINGLRAMGYYDYNDLPYYYFMASQFAMSDRWFSPAPANTNTNRHYMYAGTSDGHAYPWVGAASSSPTIWDRLTAAGISWKVYVADFNDTVFYEFINAQKYGDHIFPIQKYFDDLAAGTLPQVATLETSGLNEHPENNVQDGAAYMASAINALMASQYWKDSAFILTYDEFGGLYDHVHPQLTVNPDGKKPFDLKSTDIQGDFTRTGFRVPFLVVSPFAKPHYVSHTPADHTAILKFIETRFALQPLNARDAAQMDMTEFFDFNNPAWLTPPSTPTQPTSGPCYFDHLP